MQEISNILLNKRFAIKYKYYKEITVQVTIIFGISLIFVGFLCLLIAVLANFLL